MVEVKCFSQVKMDHSICHCQWHMSMKLVLLQKSLYLRYINITEIELKIKLSRVLTSHNNKLA